MKTVFTLPLRVGFTLLMVGISLLWASRLALAQTPLLSPTEAMSRANQGYEAGNFEEAAKTYEAIIQAGVRDSTIYYNLGNAYYKQGDLGRAVLNYRRAQALNPRDADIAANLKIVRSQTADQIEASAEGATANLIQVAEEWLTLREAALLALLLWLLIGLFALLSVLRPRWRQTCGVIMAVLAVFLVIGLISMGSRYYRDQRYPPAVVIASEANVTSGPGTADQYLLEFTLHPGTEVRLLESRPGWRRIALPGDLQGWVAEEAVEPVSIGG